MRSFELNDEASLNIYDAGFAAQMTEVFEAKIDAFYIRAMARSLGLSEICRSRTAANSLTALKWVSHAVLWRLRP